MHDVNYEKYNPIDISGKEIDFEKLYNNYFYWLCRIAKEKVNSQEEAEDIVSHLFLKLLENKESIHISGKMSSYLYQAVINNCLKYLKHIEVERNYGEHVSTYDNNIEWLLTANNNPESIFIEQETSNEIENAIKCLSEQCRKILPLWDEGLSYQEIGTIMGVSIGAVCKQINRALHKIRNRMNQE